MAASPKPPRDFFESSRLGAADHELQRKLESASTRHLEHFAEVREEFTPYEDEKTSARAIKEYSIAHLGELLVELTRNLEAHGCKVFFASTAREAREYIVRVAREAGAKRAVKGKSMTTEEIGLNPALMAAGLEVLESDLGEYIVQLRGEPPSHIITPAIHLSKEDIGELFRDKLGIAYTDEPLATKIV